MLNIREYVRAESLEQAYQLNQKKTNRILGGMLWLRMGEHNIQTAIGLEGLGLDQIIETPDEFIIGATVTLRQLECHRGLQEYTGGALKEAVRHIVGVQFRNLATVGGSIWGRFGFSDVLTFFLSLNTEVELYPSGRMPLTEFCTGKADSEILTHLFVKKEPIHCVYSSFRNTETDFPVLACAVSVQEQELRAVLGARPGKAERIPVKFDGDAERTAREIAERAKVGSNMRASAEYRKHLARVLSERALKELIGKGEL